MNGSELIQDFPLHVLVVDGDLETLKVVKERLSRVGHHVTTRTVAIGTRADIVALRPDLVLLDVAMPGLRGDDLAVMLGLYPATADTAIILHCPKGTVVRSKTGILGVIHKTQDDVSFVKQFQRLAEKLFEGALPNAATERLMSGTHPIAQQVRSLPVEERTAGGTPRGRR